eukprot:2920370-Rhodomonas_salina.2
MLSVWKIWLRGTLEAPGRTTRYTQFRTTKITSNTAENSGTKFSEPLYHTRARAREKEKKKAWKSGRAAWKHWR